MQHCPTCNRTYPDDAPAFCPNDGTHLVNDNAAYNPQPTIASPPAGYTPQYPPQAYAPQQWGQPTAQGGNKTLMLVIIGLVVAVGVGLTVYFLMRGSGSSSSYTTSNSTSSTSSNPFVGTWWIDAGSGPSDDFIRVIKSDGTLTDNYKGTTSKGTYTLSGDTLVIPAGKDTTQVWTFIGPNRVKATEKIGSDSHPLGEWVRRSESASGSTSSTTTSSSDTANRFVGTWVDEDDPHARDKIAVGPRFTADGKIMAPPRAGSEEQIGTYTANGDTATITIEGKTGTGTLVSDNRMRIEGNGQVKYVIRK